MSDGSARARLFAPTRLGPVALRNRLIKAATFEGMCPGGTPSEALIAHHRAIARGGVGMTTWPTPPSPPRAAPTTPSSSSTPATSPPSAA